MCVAEERELHGFFQQPVFTFVERNMPASRILNLFDFNLMSAHVVIRMGVVELEEQSTDQWIGSRVE